MENRIAIIGIVVEESESTNALNEILHEYSDVIIGRQGISYKNRKLGIISIVVDGDNDTINTLSGKLGMLHGINAKTTYLKVSKCHE